MNKALIKTYAKATTAMLLWGLTFVWYKVVYENGYHPLTTIFIRLVLSSIILFSILQITKKTEKIDKKDIKYFLILALLEPFFYFLGESFGLTMVSSTIASIIISTIPLFSPFIGYFFFKERLSLINIIGIVISFCGIIFMIIKPDLTISAPLIGILLLFMAVASAVFYSLFLKKLSSKYSSLTIVTYQNIIGIFYFLPLFLFWEYDDFTHTTPNFALIRNLLYLAVFGSSIAFILFTSTIRTLGISRTGVFTNTIPIFTAFASYFLLNEEFTMQKIGGIVIVLSGLFLSQMSNFRKKEVINKKEMLD